MGSGFSSAPAKISGSNSAETGLDDQKWNAVVHPNC